MKQEKEQELLCKRLAELSGNAYYRGFCTYSDFLNLDELNLFYNNYKEIVRSEYKLWGGYEDAERRVICFYEDDSSTNIFWPVACLKILPANQKFSDKLTHRDYLGAILNLGIERCKIGDILVTENAGFVFCRQEISGFILENLTRIKHTTVTVAIAEEEIDTFKPVMEEIHGTVSSIRLDSILSVAFHTSRSSLTGLIAGGKVFVNSRLIESNSYGLKEGDVVSVRGMGKFIFKETGAQTKKNRYKIMLLKYI